MKKSVSSRIRVTKNGKIMRRKMGTSHFRAKMSSKSKQDKRKAGTIHKADKKAIVKYIR
jgi:ribosomal protein L35